MSVPISYSLPRLVIVIVECTLYGAYVVLFGLTIWILARKFDIPSVKKFFFPMVIALFVLATINIVYDLVGEGYAILYSLPVKQKMWMIAGQSIDNITFTIADFLGDMILFYRVYAVWGFRKIILFPLLLMTLIAKVFNAIVTFIGIRQPIDSHTLNYLDIGLGFFFLFLVVNASANTLMTLAIAGRVWWFSRAIRHECSSELRKHWYHRTVAVVTKSRVLYPAYLIAEAAIANFQWETNPSCLGIICVGLAPTFIAVRIGLESAYDNSEHSIQHSGVVLSPPSQRTQRSSVHVFQGVSSRLAAVKSNTDSVEDIQEKMGNVV